MDCDTFDDAIVPVFDIIEALNADGTTNGIDDTDDTIVLGATTVLDAINATGAVSFLPSFMK